MESMRELPFEESKDFRKRRELRLGLLRNGDMDIGAVESPAQCGFEVGYELGQDNGVQPIEDRLDEFLVDLSLVDQVHFEGHGNKRWRPRVLARPPMGSSLETLGNVL